MSNERKVFLEFFEINAMGPLDGQGPKTFVGAVSPEDGSGGDVCQCFWYENGAWYGGTTTGHSGAADVAQMMTGVLLVSAGLAGEVWSLLFKKNGETEKSRFGFRKRRAKGFDPFGSAESFDCCRDPD